MLDWVGQKGGIKDPNVEPSLLDDPDRKQAASGTNKIVVDNARIAYDEAKAEGADDFEAFNAAMDYVDLWFVAPEGPEGLGPTPYTNSIDRRAGILEAADLSDETKHKKAVKNAYFNTTRLSTDDLHPDVLKRPLQHPGRKHPRGAAGVHRGESGRHPTPVQTGGDAVVRRPDISAQGYRRYAHS